MSRFISVTAIVAFVSLFCWGCTSNTTPETTASSHQDTTTVLCGLCGDAKGSDACCSEDAAKCDSCGLAKGSKLCCVELGEEVAGKDLCGKCGHVAGSDQCCAEDAETCACGLTKGSPLCCKLKADETAEATSTEETEATE